jgi:PAS domain S-box-containing protein
MKAQRKTSQRDNGGKSKSSKRSMRESKSSREKHIRPLAPRQFVDIVEHINDGLVVLDKDWHYVYVNQKAAVMLQRPKPSDLIGKHIWTEYPEGVGQPFHVAYEKAMREQIAIVFEEHYEPWDLWFENRVYPSPDGLLILFTDITERKRMERLLEDRQHLLQKILDTEPGTVYVYDLEERRNVYVNRHWLSAFGYTAEETQAMGDDFAALIFHPDDLPLIAEHHANWQQAGEGEIRSVEYRVRSKGGEWYWVHSREAPFTRDETGQVRQILGIAHDITERKQVEKALRESEEKFSKVFYASPIPLNINRLSDGRYVEVNESFLKRMGYHREELLGKTALEIGAWVHPEESENFFQSLRTQGSLRDFEAQFRTKSGEIGTALLFREVVELAGEKYFVGTNLDITERKRAEEALRASEARYRAVVENQTEFIVRWKPDGTRTFVNEAYCRYFGLTPQQAHSTDFIPLIVEEDRAAVQVKISRIRSGEARAETDIHRVIKPDGSIGWQEWIDQAIYDESGQIVEFQSVGRDVTERKRTEDALAASEAEFRALFAAMDDVLFVIDRDGVYRKVAPTNPRLLYKPRQELLGKSVQDVFPAEQAQAFINTIRQVIESQQTTRIEYQLAIEGQEVWFDASLSPISADSILWMARDITDRKRAEERLQRLNEELEQRVFQRTEALAAAMIKAQEADRLKSAFLATMSHELRTPLNSIIGFTGVILQGLAGPLNEEQTKQLNMTRDSARHLLALINDVLDISKIEAGQLEIFKRPFDMRQSIENALRVVQPLAQKKDLQLRTSIGLSVGKINQDRRRVEQVLINLINNAIKFTERGEVYVDCQLSDGWLTTCVRDTGIGIKPEDMDRLFKPFQQIESGLARHHEGTGLGLSICRRLVIAMGGEITVESQWSTGSTFKFTLPI